MKLLLMTGPLFPQPGNNATLIGKLIPFFLSAGHEVHLFSFAFGEVQNALPDECFGVPVHWATDQKHDWKRRLLYPAISKVVDPNGFSDALQIQILMRELKSICRQYPFDVAISTSEPYVMASTASQLYGGKKVLYMMDPPAGVSNGTGTAYRSRILPSILKNQDALVTTPFILEALKAHRLPLPKKTEAVGFPMIMPQATRKSRADEDKVRLLFCGWLYSDIRSPRYFLDIVSRLNEQFEVTFMGRECEMLLERFPVNTKAKIITLPQQLYEIALHAMSDSDILINIGNSVPVHMPSKTLEYINTGKPIVNFYKIPDCPTLYYTQRYPLALNIFEDENNISFAAQTFTAFCLAQKGKTLDHAWIEREYVDCKPQYIAQRILDFLEK